MENKMRREKGKYTREGRADGKRRKEREKHLVTEKKSCFLFSLPEAISDRQVAPAFQKPLLTVRFSRLPAA